MFLRYKSYNREQVIDKNFSFGGHICSYEYYTDKGRGYHVVRRPRSAQFRQSSFNFIRIAFGSVAGGLAGLVGDVLGVIINSHGAPMIHPGFTLSSVLTGALPGIIVILSGKKGLHYSM